MTAPRVVVLADDLIWSTRLVAAVRAAGVETRTARTIDGLTAALGAGAGHAIVDLTALAYDGVEAVGVAAGMGASVLAVGQHDDTALRKRALGAGAWRVLAYRKLFESGPAIIVAWLGRPVPTPSGPTAGVPVP